MELQSKFQFFNGSVYAWKQVMKSIFLEAYLEVCKFL